MIRLPLEPAAPDGERLGTLHVALSQSELRSVSLEGEPLTLDWQADDRFETRGAWVKDAVREATARLGRGAR